MYQCNVSQGSRGGQGVVVCEKGDCRQLKEGVDRLGLPGRAPGAMPRLHRARVGRPADGELLPKVPPHFRTEI